MKPQEMPPLGLGLASVVLGAVGLLLFILPILAMPISGCGLVIGVVGVIAAAAGSRIDLRMALAGTALCGLALAIDTAIAYAPNSDYGQPSPPLMTAPGLPRYIPPPARFEG